MYKPLQQIQVAEADGEGIIFALDINGQLWFGAIDVKEAQEEEKVQIVWVEMNNPGQIEEKQNVFDEFEKGVKDAVDQQDRS